ncbi:MAG: CHAD domain-containing protein, partial [Planctomycetota bacterium]
SHAHESVIEMLQSMHWARHLQEWDDILERSTERTAENDQKPISLERSLTKARAALDRALLLNDDHCWHKLRIRIKEVRYLAETGAGDDADGETAKVIASCKQLQTLLGDWHDTVVQLNLLDELPAHPVHEKLAQLISERKQQFLAQASKILESHPLLVDS